MVAAGPALFLTALDSPRARRRLTLRRSDDGGSSWDDVLVLRSPVCLLVDARVARRARANASTTKAAGAVTVGVLSERGAAGGFFAERIDFQRVTVY